MSNTLRNIGNGIVDYITGRDANGVNRFQRAQNRRAPIVHSESDDARIVLYDDNSMSGVAARANANAIYGSNNVGSNFARRAVIEVKGSDGNWTPVNQLNPGAGMEEQIAALHSYRETGQLAGLAEGSNVISSSDLPGGTQAADTSRTLTLARQAVSSQTSTQGSSDFQGAAPVQSSRPQARPPQQAGRSQFAGGPTGGIIDPIRTSDQIRDTQQFSMTGSMMDYARAISSIESGSAEGNYSALGRVMETGSYKGDRAYGRYQVMGRNVPQWTKEALGYAMTPEEFLASPQAQDAVFANQFQKAIDRYGSPQDAASVWFTGRPASNVSAQRSSDGNINGAEYVRRFNAALGNNPANNANPLSETDLVERQAQRPAPGVESTGPEVMDRAPSQPVAPQPSIQPVETLTGRTPSKVEETTDLSLVDRVLPDVFDPRQESQVLGRQPIRFF